MRHDECCLLFAKRDEDTRKRIAALYHYVNTLPLTKHQRSKLIRLAEEALTSAEDNGYHFAMYDTGFCDFMEAADQFFKKIYDAVFSENQEVP